MTSTFQEVGLLIHALISVVLMSCGTVFSEACFAQSPTAKAPGQTTPSPYRALPYEEDWQFTRDLDPKDEDVFYKLKLIPLGRSGVTFSLGGELRATFDWESDLDFGRKKAGNDDIFLTRLQGHADLKLSESLRIFGTLQFSEEEGRNGLPRAIDVDRGDIQNFFIEYNNPLMKDFHLTTRLGRQELQYGGGRLVTARLGRNVRRTFDGFKAVLTIQDWTVDAFVFSPVDDEIGSFDDQATDGETFWGVYVDSAAILKQSSTHFYYLGRNEDEAAFARGTGASERHTLGFRVAGSKGKWDWDWETAYQFGDFSKDSISAFTFATSTGLQFRNIPGGPRFGLSTSVIAGDDDLNDSTLGSFDALYPNGSYFSQIGLIGPRNLLHAQPQLNIKMAKDWALTLYGNAFWRESLSDAVYSPNGRILAENTASRNRYVGSSFGTSIAWQMTNHVKLSVDYVHFQAGDFLEAAGATSDPDFVEIEITHRF